jgi:hypothetical protein
MINILRRLETTDKGFPQKHNLSQLWNETRTLLVKHYPDQEIPGIAGMDNCIEEFSKHDPESFAFRYPSDKKGCKTLDELKHINLRHLYEAIERVNHFIGCISADIGHHLECRLENHN